MRHLRNVVLPVQVVALFVLPAIMLTIIMSAIAIMFMVLTPLSYHDVTTSVPAGIFGFIGYICMVVAVGNFMWDE